MANHEDFERLRSGKEAWNEWVSGDESRKVDLSGIKLGDCNFEGYVFPAYTDFTRCRFANAAVFANSKFIGDASFVEAQFHATANFRSAQTKGVDFDRAHFSGDLNLRDATLEGTASFSNCKFNNNVTASALRAKGPAFFHDAEFDSDLVLDEAIFGDRTFFDSAQFSKFASFHSVRFGTAATFADSIFKSAAWFEQAEFAGKASFERVDFLGTATFVDARFHTTASFRHANSKGPFSLERATFKKVPDLMGMSFRAPPRLDDLSVADSGRFRWRGNLDEAARYRYLKKLAVEGHDHTREQFFFANELRQRRCSEDKPLGRGAAAFWFGYAYEALSDFGRSPLRPIIWWVCSIVFFAITYGSFRPQGHACEWPTGRLLPEFYLALVHAIPLAGLKRTPIHELAVSCLFAWDGAVWPGAEILFILQNVIAVILIFLFVLALRNHFKIR